MTWIDFNGKIALQEIPKEFYKSPQKCNMFNSLTFGKKKWMVA